LPTWWLSSRLTAGAIVGKGGGDGAGLGAGAGAGAGPAAGGDESPPPPPQPLTTITNRAVSQCNPAARGAATETFFFMRAPWGINRSFSARRTPVAAQRQFVFLNHT
jgi:hypothetical protein